MHTAPILLRADHALDPLHCGPLPYLAWQPGCAQTAYEIRAERERAPLVSGSGARWHSGIVASDSCAEVVWAGAALDHGEVVWWTVRVRDDGGLWSAWAEPARIECGLVDWTSSRWLGFSGGWPGRVLLVRGSFHLSQPAVRARLYVASPGGCQVSLNSRQMTASGLNPGMSVFAKRVAYRVLAIEEHLTTGENILGAVLGTGWYGMPMLRAVMCAWHADGSCTRVVSTNSWHVGVGETLNSSPYDGEDADMRQRQAGWELPGFNAWNAPVTRTRRWFMAHVLDGPAGILQPHAMEDEG